MNPLVCHPGCLAAPMPSTHQEPAMAVLQFVTSPSPLTSPSYTIPMPPCPHGVKHLMFFVSHTPRSLHLRNSQRSHDHISFRLMAILLTPKD